MKYFTTEFIQFLEQLSKNNSFEWFDENRKTYEKQVKKPFVNFIQEMISRIHEIDSEIKIKPSESITRINKDIRFTKDKTPYNTYVGAVLSPVGKKDKSVPGIYLQFSHDKILIYGGSYALNNEKLEKVRNYISSHLTAFSVAYNDPLFIEKYDKILGEKSKRLPTLYQEIISKEPLIANKQFYFIATLAPELLIQDKLPEVILNYYFAAKKVNAFLKQALNNSL